MFMPYMYCLTVINVAPMYCTLRGRAVGVTTLLSLVAPCRCDNNLWCRGVVIVTAPPPPPLFNVYTQTNIYIYMPSFWRWYTYWYLISLALRQMAGIPQQTTFSSLYCLMKIKCFEKWSKFQHGIGYWLGAVQATNHCLNQCWHSSSTHIYVSQCDWIEYYAILWSWWSYNNRNGCVVEVAARVVTGGAEACRGGHPGRRIRFIDEIALHSYLLYTVFNTLRPRQDGCLFADDILKCIFLNGNSWIPNKISWEHVA